MLIHLINIKKLHSNNLCFFRTFASIILTTQHFLFGETQNFSLPLTQDTLASVATPLSQSQKPWLLFIAKALGLSKYFVWFLCLKVL